jgi:hypothetical protein
VVGRRVLSAELLITVRICGHRGADFAYQRRDGGRRVGFRGDVGEGPRHCWNGRISIHELHEFPELVAAIWNAQAKSGRQTTHGVREHRLLLDQQGSGEMKGLDTLLLQALDGCYQRREFALDPPV